METGVTSRSDGVLIPDAHNFVGIYATDSPAGGEDGGQGIYGSFRPIAHHRVE